MNYFKVKNCAVIVLAAVFGLFIAAGCVPPKTPVATTPAPATPKPLSPGPNDASIAYRTARLLEDNHYSQQLLDTSMSEKFFDGYVEMLDPRRENFLQSDIDGFAFYRTNLNTFTVGGHGRSDLTPAYEIFERFLERITQHTDYANQLLKQDQFRFNTDERIALDRRHAPYPKDIAEAQDLWRQQLRYAYLQEKLDHEFSATNNGMALPLSKSANAEITAQLERRYDQTLHYFTNWDSDNILQVYLNALTHAYDPHTDYLNQEHAADFSISMSLSLFGIGAKLSEDDGYCTIDSLITGGPADKSKQIKEKDRVIAVAQSNSPPVNVVDMELPKVVELIRGPKGTQVRLTLEEKANPASRHVVVLMRDEIKLEDQEAKARLIEQPDANGGTNRIGVISVPQFYFPTDLSGNTGHSKQSFISVDVAKLLKKLEQEKVGGIILDIRGNPGGSLEEAIRFTGLFIKQGPVVLARNTDGQVQIDSTSEADPVYSGPLVVLINRFSASAAEIAAAALQDYGRAIVIGDVSTHGKGTVQSLTPLDKYIWPATPTATNDPGTLKITIRKFYRVTGASTQLKGVEPDIVLPDVWNYSTDIGESSLDNPLPWDSIHGVDFNRLNLVQPYVADLRRRSDDRIATNQDFIYTRQDIDEFKKEQADKTAMLNEQEALKERQKISVQKTARDEEISKRNPPNENIYEITVENADDPGLPPPIPLTTTNSGVTLAVSTNTLSQPSQIIENTNTNQLSKPVISSAIPPDPMLDEAVRILQDYISALSKNASLIANQ
jgi:carboxyl-terminal processing protease